MSFSRPYSFFAEVSGRYLDRYSLYGIMGNITIWPFSFLVTLSVFVFVLFLSIFLSPPNQNRLFVVDTHQRRCHTVYASHVACIVIKSLMRLRPLKRRNIWFLNLLEEHWNGWYVIEFPRSKRAYLTTISSARERDATYALSRIAKLFATVESMQENVNTMRASLRELRDSWVHTLLISERSSYGVWA